MATTAALTDNSRQGFELEKPVCIGLEYLLSRNTRQGWGHVYDTTPLGLAVYVRNDPVNLVDPDGHYACAIDGILCDKYIDYLTQTFAWLFGKDPKGSPDANKVSPHERRLDELGVDLRTAKAIVRASSAVQNNEDCKKFLSSVISNLQLKDKNGNLMTPQGLVGLLTPDTIEDNAPNDQTGGPAYTIGGVVHLTSSAYKSYLYATLIHEAFHLLGPDNDKLSSAMKKSDEGWGPLPGAGDERTGYVARHCRGI